MENSRHNVEWPKQNMERSKHEFEHGQQNVEHAQHDFEGAQHRVEQRQHDLEHGQRDFDLAQHNLEEPQRRFAKAQLLGRRPQPAGAQERRQSCRRSPGLTWGDKNVAPPKGGNWIGPPRGWVSRWPTGPGQDVSGAERAPPAWDRQVVQACHRRGRRVCLPAQGVREEGCSAFPSIRREN